MKDDARPVERRQIFLAASMHELLVEELTMALADYRADPNMREREEKVRRLLQIVRTAERDGVMLREFKSIDGHVTLLISDLPSSPLTIDAVDSDGHGVHAPLADADALDLAWSIINTIRG